MNAASFASLSASLPPLFGASLAVRTLIEYLIIAGAVLLVTFAVLVWALVFRKPGKRRHSHHPPAAESHRRESKTTRSQSRRRRRNFPRQPTLAETGGLPPLRQPQAVPTDSQPPG
ncbi:MAG: hypothetical protein KBH45_07770 [Verrucomicrobia bacterium]|nr:hypothetical protein [Verrucomicrobiota bacterium]